MAKDWLEWKEMLIIRLPHWPEQDRKIINLDNTITNYLFLKIPIKKRKGRWENQTKSKNI